MGSDVKVCLCFGVSRRKIENFLRVEKPARESQLSECFGAGTGCGWCRPYLRELFQRARGEEPPTQFESMTPQQYAAARQRYRREHRRGDPNSKN